MLGTAEKPKHGRRGYHLRNSQRHVTPSRSYPTILSDMIALLKLGTDKAVADWLGAPATPAAVKSWRRGDRATPAWVRQCAVETRAKHAQQVSELEARAKKEAGESAGP